MIETLHLKAHRVTASMLKKKIVSAVSGAQKKG